MLSFTTQTAFINWSIVFIILTRFSVLGSPSVLREHKRAEFKSEANTCVDATLPLGPDGPMSSALTSYRRASTHKSDTSRKREVTVKPLAAGGTAGHDSTVPEETWIDPGLFADAHGWYNLVKEQFADTWISVFSATTNKWVTSQRHLKNLCCVNRQERDTHPQRAATPHRGRAIVSA